jgi:hypothetical protein
MPRISTTGRLLRRLAQVATTHPAWILSLALLLAVTGVGYSLAKLTGAAGLAVGIAFICGLARQRTSVLGNFWVDVTRAVLWAGTPAHDRRNPPHG